jgi:hypothetical protein
VGIIGESSGRESLEKGDGWLQGSLDRAAHQMQLMLETIHQECIKPWRYGTGAMATFLVGEPAL